MLTSTEGQYADAQARLASAERQLKRTEVHSPFAGVVSERKINVGDDVTPGTPLFTVVDLGSLRFEAAVPSEQLQVIHVGMPVEFTVDGFPGRVSIGKITRINPAVDPATRQVRISIAVPQRDRPAGDGPLRQRPDRGEVAERRGGAGGGGRRARSRSAGLQGDRRQGAEGHRSQLGVRDDLAEQVEITSGVAAGDTLLMGSAQGISEGSLVQVGGGVAACSSPISRSRSRSSPSP